MTRPDISFVMSKLCQYMADPNMKCYEAALNVLLYLDKTKDLSIRYSNGSSVFDGLRDEQAAIDGNLGFVAYSDSSFGDAQPVYGYCCFMANGPIAFCSKKLKSAQSSCEAEYAAAFFAAKEIAFIRNVLDDLGFPCSGYTVLGCDNSAAIDVANDLGVSARIKHFERAIHLVRDMVTELKMKLVFVRTTNQLADIFTKPLGKTDFQRLRNRFLLLSGV